jgi:hypothetical protein
MHGTANGEQNNDAERLGKFTPIYPEFFFRGLSRSVPIYPEALFRDVLYRGALFRDDFNRDVLDRDSFIGAACPALFCRGLRLLAAAQLLAISFSGALGGRALAW